MSVTADYHMINMAENKPVVLQQKAGTNELLNDLFDVISLDDLIEGSAQAEDVEGIVISKYFASNPVFRDELLPRMSKLKMVVPIGVGIDSFEHLMDYFVQKGVTVALNPGDRHMCHAVADYAIGLMLNCARGIQRGIKYIKITDAKTVADWLPFKSEILKHTIPFTKATLGIIGMGTIGYEVAKKAYYGFNMTILYFGRNRKDPEVEQSVEAKFFADLDEMLPFCDYVLVACSSAPQTRNMVGAEQFMQMKKSAIIINIARGDIIATDALTEALLEGHIGGAGLDVTYPEPLPQGHPLTNMENVVLTPHSAWALSDVRQELKESVVHNLKTVLIDGGVPKVVAK